MTVTAAKKSPRCSFCGKEAGSVQRLVAGPGVYICDECVGLCNQIIAEELAKPVPTGRQEQDGPARIRAWERLSDEELLSEMVRAHAAHDNVDRAVAHHVTVLRQRGVSWARIGEALGMTRQSAWERFSGED